MELSPDLYREAIRSFSSKPPRPGRPLMEVPLPVRMAMCASISLRADSTLSGNPVTSKTGSLSRLGVTM